jgi:hypothetical protein
LVLLESVAQLSPAPPELLSQPEEEAPESQVESLPPVEPLSQLPVSPLSQPDLEEPLSDLVSKDCVLEFNSRRLWLRDEDGVEGVREEAPLSLLFAPVNPTPLWLRARRLRDDDMISLYRSLTTTKSNQQIK